MRAKTALLAQVGASPGQVLSPLTLANDGVALPVGGMLARLKAAEIKAQLAALDGELARLGWTKEAGGASQTPPG